MPVQGRVGQADSDSLLRRRSCRALGSVQSPPVACHVPGPLGAAGHADSPPRSARRAGCTGPVSNQGRSRLPH
eukprot:6734085-Alexandrium_andersonii.AAC.1